MKMKKQWLAWLGVGGLLMVLTWTTTARAARPLGVSETPTMGLFLPVVLRDATLTPSQTPTPTVTPTLTRTPTPTATATQPPTATATGTVPPAQAMNGHLWREDGTKPSYATNIEDVWHWFWIQNNNSATVYYGILGVNVYKDAQYNFFHTSWSGEQAVNGVLYINGGGCFGPGGYPCAGSAAGAQQRDTIKVAQPGNYSLTLAICQSSFWGCQQPGGQWQNLETVYFTAIDWTPQPGAPLATPAEPCRLVTDEPGGTYLKCRP